VNLKDWSLWDASGNDFLIDKTIILQPGDYYVISRSRPDFKRFYPEITRLWGDLTFGLDNVSDGIALVDAQGRVHDQVQYESTNPWPEGANGLGYTLELINPGYDNSIPDNWRASIVLTGTPGSKNSQSLVNVEKQNAVRAKPEFKVYPSPFHSYSIIYFTLDQKDRILVSIYDIKGQLVKTFSEKSFDPGGHTIRWIPDPGLQPGVYLVRLQSSMGTQTLKLVFR
jgi:hypothetical protein